MGLKEPGLRGSLRNVSVGIDAIPDAYLSDDWGDDRLTDREGSGTTTYNGVEGVFRPEYTIDSGSPSATNGTLNWSAGDQFYTNINLNLDETVTWEIKNTVSVSSDRCFVTLFSETTSFGGEGRPISSYVLVIDGSDRLVFTIDDTASSGGFLSGTGSDGDDVTITRSPNGDWELIVDGTSQDTGSDTQFTNPESFGFSARSDQSGEAEIDEIKVS